MESQEFGQRVADLIEETQQILSELRGNGHAESSLYAYFRQKTRLLEGMWLAVDGNHQTSVTLSLQDIENIYVQLKYEIHAAYVKWKRSCRAAVLSD